MPVLAINGGEKTRTEGWPAWPPDDPGKVIESKVWGVGGEWTRKAEEMMAEYHDAKFAAACTSGTAASPAGTARAEIVGTELIILLTLLGII